MTSTTPNEPDGSHGPDPKPSGPVASDGKTVSPAAAPSEPEIADELYCQDCGYNLRGLTSMRCPECGESLDAVRAMEPRLPWTHRKTVGRFRAYWKTVYFVTFRTRVFAEELARPVKYGDAQGFRWMTLLHIYLPLVVATVFVYWLYAPGPGPVRQFASRFEQTLASVWPCVVFHLGLLLWLAAASGVAGYFYHPRDMPVRQQNRAIALSYYTLAPLAWIAAPLMFALLGAWLAETGWLKKPPEEGIPMGLIVFAIALFLLELTAWVSVSAEFARRVLPRHTTRRLVVVLSLPVLWAVLAAIIFAGIGFLTFVVFLVVASFG